LILLELWLMGSLAGVLHADAQPVPGETTIRVMTYNIHHGEGRDRKIDLDRIARVIGQAQPDVVCLQEADRDLPRTGHADFPALLAQKLNMTAVFEPNYRFDGGEYGNATLTRFEVVAHENMPLPNPKGSEPRGCLKTVIRVNGRLVEVLNTHLGLDPEERKQQAAAILAHQGEGPAILAGDLNEPRDAPVLALLLTRFKDTAPASSDPAAETFRARTAIDFVLVSGGLDILSSRVVSTLETAVASDHVPRVADVVARAPADRAADEGVYDTDDERVTEAIMEGM
jgi:endonuclease/exonuclease/phosphatase family metal-dependent hydrolase